MNKSKVLLYLMVIIAIILCIPSLVYLINYKTVDGFNAYYTYTLNDWSNSLLGLTNGIIVIGLLLIASILYILVIKSEKKIFKNKKQIFIFIEIVAFVFMLILPYLSSDIYYYMGDSWLLAEYKENPYYTTVSELQRKGINDEILNNTGVWKNTTSIYGPIWNNIAATLMKFSFGSVTIALFIFKIVAYFIHLANTYLIYKITKSNKYMLLYGLNPLVLIEFLSNVHNDAYLILFILLALYFLIRKKDIVLTIIFLAISVGIKYSTILLVPFILIYCFRKERIFKRILYCLISGLNIIALVVLFYIPYYRDFTIFANMLVQGNKFNQSIMLFLLLNMDKAIFWKIYPLNVPIFMGIYVIVLLTMLFKKKIIFKDVIRKYNLIMLIFIFIVLATFQKWYILWLLPTMIWQSKNMRKFIIYLTILAIIPSINYFIDGLESFRNGNLYSASVLFLGVLAILIDMLFQKIKDNKKGKKCQI